MELQAEFDQTPQTLTDDQNTLSLLGITFRTRTLLNVRFSMRAT
jgi:hypothetical protein